MILEIYLPVYLSVYPLGSEVSPERPRSKLPVLPEADQTSYKRFSQKIGHTMKTEMDMTECRYFRFHSQTFKMKRTSSGKHLRLFSKVSIYKIIANILVQ